MSGQEDPLTSSLLQDQSEDGDYFSCAESGDEHMKGTSPSAPKEEEGWLAAARRAHYLQLQNSTSEQPSTNYCRTTKSCPSEQTCHVPRLARLSLDSTFYSVDDESIATVSLDEALQIAASYAKFRGRVSPMHVWNSHDLSDGVFCRRASSEPQINSQLNSSTASVRVPSTGSTRSTGLPAKRRQTYCQRSRVTSTGKSATTNVASTEVGAMNVTTRKVTTTNVATTSDTSTRLGATKFATAKAAASRSRLETCRITHNQQLTNSHNVGNRHFQTDRSCPARPTPSSLFRSQTRPSVDSRKSQLKSSKFVPRVSTSSEALRTSKSSLSTEPNNSFGFSDPSKKN